jgi:hypothetical protein
VNDGDWLRKRMRNPRAGCSVLALALLVAGLGMWSLVVSA